MQGDGFFIRRVTRKPSVRWLIRLPDSFEGYMSSLRPTTRKAVLRAARLFEKERPEIVAIHQPADIERLLRDGEKVSRITYQWHVATRLCDDAQTRQRFTQLAQRGQFRGHIAYIGGKPCAFICGEMNRHGVFYAQVTGFDPQYRKLSPGTALLIRLIRDLIENTDCKLLDLGPTQDDQSYKTRFGNVCLNTAWLHVVRWRRPSSLLMTGLDETLNLAKNLASSIVGYDKRSKLARGGPQ
jgi:hypothetical protein